MTATYCQALPWQPANLLPPHPPLWGGGSGGGSDGAGVKSELFTAVESSDPPVVGRPGPLVGYR